MKRAFLALWLVLTCLGGAGCQVSGSVVATETVEQSLVVERGPRIVVETFNGRIGVVAGSDTGVEVRVVKRGSGTSQAAADRDLAQVELTVVPEFGRVTVTARRRDQPLGLGNSGADIDLSVPIDSSLELRTSNGRVEAANVRGKIVARSSNGAVTIRDGNGVDAETSNGPLTVNAATGRLELRTSNGTLDVIGAEDATVTAETTNGDITFAGSLAEGSHTFRTTNAAIRLALPSSAEFSFEGHTSNGNVSTVYPLLIGDDSLTGTVGISPPTAIRADTSNGDLSLTSQP